jgi:hypothetical protein
MRQDACMTPDPTKAAQRRDDELKSLGVVVELGATMEQALHDAFCTNGNKFAAVVAAGQNVTWLIETARPSPRHMPTYRNSINNRSGML